MNDKELVFVGLDGEMTGGDWRRHRLIQIGVALSENEVFASRISWEDADHDPEALEAIGMKPEAIREGPAAAEVDAAVTAWLAAKGIGERTLVAVGWGVSTFDIPFVEAALPRLMSYLHHHTVELNALAYLLGDVKPYLGRRPGSAGWKSMAKYAGEALIFLKQDRLPKRHDAGDDALQALLAFQWLRNISADPLPAGLSAAPHPPETGGRVTTRDATRGAWLSRM